MKNKDEMKLNKANVIRFICTIIVLCIIAFASLTNELFINSRNTVQVEAEDTQYLSVKNNTVQQEIILEGLLTNVRFYMIAPNGTLYENAEVTFKIEQGNIVIENTIDAKTLSDGWYDFEPLGNKISEGEAVISVTGNNFPEGTDVFLLLSNVAGTELDNAMFNNNVLTGPIILHYSVLRFDSYFWYDVFMVLIMLALLITISYLYVYKFAFFQKKERIFLISCILIFAHTALKNPTSVFWAEPFSEVAYEFWYKAHTMSFFENLMSLMSGECLAWTERILMYVADVLSVTNKYVFVIAQAFQLLMICIFSSLFTLSYFRKFFSDEIRFLLSFFVGSSLLFADAYYFWAVSYWAILFLIPVMFMDMKSMPRIKYVMILIISIVLTVSRIYHIVFIPIALLLLFYLGKERGKRYKIYCSIIALAALFETGYSMLFGGQGHLEGNMDLGRCIVNTIYYQIQVLISYFCGASVKNALMANIVFGAIFVAIIAFFVLLVIRREKKYAAAIGALGILSVGTVGINVCVCGMSDSVAFPHDYAAKIDWTQYYYQQADLHFSYSYIALTCIWIVVAYYIKQKLKRRYEIYFNNADLNTFVTNIAVILVVVVITNYQLLNCFNINMIGSVSTDWKKMYKVTENESYYMAINVIYPVAHISLEQNSTGYIYGMTADDRLIFWNSEKQPYDIYKKYSTAKIGSVSDIEAREILSITVRKNSINFASPYTAILYDCNMKELARIPQTNDARRWWMEFILDEPISGVYCVSFVDENENVVYVRDGLQIGVVNK